MAAAITLPIDGTTSHCLGFGTHTHLYEKRTPFVFNGCYLTDSESERLMSDCLSLFSWMRINVCGAESYRENPLGTRNYPANLQAVRLAQLNQNVSLRYIVTPASAPSSCIFG